MIKINYIYTIMILISCFASLQCMDQNNRDSKTALEKIGDERLQPSGAAQASTAFAPINYKGTRLNNAQSDAFLNKVPEDIAEIIAQKTFHFIKMKAYRNREALLPAIIKASYALNTTMHTMLAVTAKKYEEFSETIPENYVAHKLIVSVQTFGNQLIAANNNQVPLRSNDLIESVTCENLLGRKLCANEFAIVGYDDGTHEIKLSEIDNDRLIKLSVEQLDFIIEAYSTFSLDDLIQNKSHKVIFDSLPSSMKENIKQNNAPQKKPHVEMHRDAPHSQNYGEYCDCSSCCECVCLSGIMCCIFFALKDFHCRSIGSTC